MVTDKRIVDLIEDTSRKRAGWMCKKHKQNICVCVVIQWKMIFSIDEDLLIKVKYEIPTVVSFIWQDALNTGLPIISRRFHLPNHTASKSL